MKCPFCNKENKCRECGKKVKELGRSSLDSSWVECKNCVAKKNKEKNKISLKTVIKQKKTGGGGNKMEDVDEFFDKTMEKLNQLGSGDKREQEVNSNGRNEEIRYLQKQAQKAIEVKQRRNDKQNKTFKGV